MSVCSPCSFVFKFSNAKRHSAQRVGVPRLRQMEGMVKLDPLSSFSGDSWSPHLLDRCVEDFLTGTNNQTISNPTWTLGDDALKYSEIQVSVHASTPSTRNSPPWTVWASSDAPAQRLRLTPGPGEEQGSNKKPQRWDPNHSN